MGNRFKSVFIQHLSSIILMLLGVAVVALFAQSYRTTRQESAYHQEVLFRTANSTAREISLYIEGIRRALQLFADRERVMLGKIASDTENTRSVELPGEQMRRYFPGHLAFAIADPLSRTLVASEAHLFGRHCQATLDVFSDSEITRSPVPFVHSSGSPGTRHFDILVSIPDAKRREHNAGLLFASFRLNDINRLLENGMSNTLLLNLTQAEQSDGSQGISLLMDETGPGEAMHAGTDGNFELPAEFIRTHVEGTSWDLIAWLDPELKFQASRGSLIQAAVGSLALVLAGIIVRRATTREQVSKRQASIVIASVDEERKRIARDLHDQVLADISHTRRLLTELSSDREPRQKLFSNTLNEIQQSASRISSTIRTTIEDLHPHTLELLGLCHGIEAYVQSRCHAGPECRLLLMEEVETMLVPEQKLQLYRIVTELINNALQHSNCNTLSVSLSLNGKAGVVTLVIEDDGDGFVYKNVRLPGHHGLTNIESRASILGARIRWLGTPKGTLKGTPKGAPKGAPMGGSRFELDLVI
jgi:signal transduction histidine kinase